jgi:hypothetical protein
LHPDVLNKHSSMPCAVHRNRHRKNASTMTTAATMAKTPSALMLAPQRSMKSLSDMHGSPLKTGRALRTIHLRAGAAARQGRLKLPGVGTTPGIRLTYLETQGLVYHRSRKLFWLVHSF